MSTHARQSAGCPRCACFEVAVAEVKAEGFDVVGNRRGVARQPRRDPLADRLERGLDPPLVEPDLDADVPLDRELAVGNAVQHPAQLSHLGRLVAGLQRGELGLHDRRGHDGDGRRHGDLEADVRRDPAFALVLREPLVRCERGVGVTQVRIPDVAGRAPVGKTDLTGRDLLVEGMALLEAVEPVEHLGGPAGPPAALAGLAVRDPLDVATQAPRPRRETPRRCSAAARCRRDAHQPRCRGQPSYGPSSIDTTNLDGA